MIGAPMLHFKILEKLPTTFLKSKTPSGQAGKGGMANKAREVKPYHPIAFEFLALEFT